MQKGNVIISLKSGPKAAAIIHKVFWNKAFEKRIVFYGLEKNSLLTLL